MNNTRIETEYKALPFEVKELTDDGTFTGYAASYSKDLGGDVIEKGAFADTLKENGGKVPILFNHSWMRPIGYGLDAKEDDRGLLVTGEFTLGSTDGRDAYETAKHAAKRKQHHGLSIGYSIREGGAEQRGETRRLKALNLHEYSMAVFPMNPKARIREVKATYTEREFEEILRNFGFAREQAMIICSRGFKALNAQRESDGSGSGAQRESDGGAKVDSLLREFELFTLMTRMQEFTRHG